MRRRWTLFVGVVAIALAVGAVLRWGLPAGSGGRSESELRAVDARPDAPVLVGRGPAVAPALAAGGVRGTVRNADGPVAATVTLVRGKPVSEWSQRYAIPVRAREAALTTQAGADGVFAFGTVPAGRWICTARTAEGARGHATVEVANANTRVDVLVGWGGGLTLKGRVEQSDGTPWRGSVDVVQVEPEWTVASAFTPHATDDSGHFAVEGLRAGPAWVVAWEEARVRWNSRRLMLPLEGEFVLRLPAPSPELLVRVLDAATGVPIAGATVSALRGQRIGSVEVTRHEARTDASGECRLAASAEWMHAEAAGYEDADGGEMSAGEAVLLRLRPLSSIRGRVVERGSGLPAAGAVVRTLGGTRVAGNPTAIADAAGRFELLGVRLGTVSVVVGGGGWCSPGLAVHDPASVSQWASEVPVGGVEGLVLEAERAGRVRGVVRRVDGGSAAEASVRVEVQDWLPEWWITSATDESGTFEVASVVPGSPVTLRVEARDGARGIGGPVTTTSGGEATCDVTLETGRTVVLYARDVEGGAPALGAVVHAEVDSTTLGKVGLARSVDGAQGVRFSMLPVGPLKVYGWGNGWGRVEQAVPDASTGDVETTILLRRVEGRIAGKVRFEDGWTPPSGALKVATQTGSGLASIDGGRFALEGVDPGSHRLQFWLGELPEPILEMEATTGQEDLDVVLPPPRARGVTLRLLAPDGSGGVACVYQVAGPDGLTSGSTSGGRLVVEPFVAPAWVLLSSAHDAMGRPLDAAPTLVGPLPNDGRTLDVRLDAGRRLVGRVLDGSGHGVARASVIAEALLPPLPSNQGDGDPSPEHASAVTDATGRFTLVGLGGGPHRIDARSGDAYSQVRWTGAGDAEVVLVLVGPARTEIRVVDPQGRPVAGAQVEDCASATDAEGRTWCDCLPDVWRSLDVTPPRDRTDLRRLQGFPWRPGGPPIALPAAGTIRGVVVDPEGKPVADAEVSLAPHEDAWSARSTEIFRGDDGRATTTTDEAGRFSFEHVPLALHDLWAGQGDLHAARVEASPSEREIRLTLRRGVALVVRTDLEAEWLRLASTTASPGELEVAFEEGRTARLDGLDPTGRYDLFAELDDPPRVAALRDVRGDAQEVRLRFVPALDLVGHAHGATPGAEISVKVGGHGLDEKHVWARADGMFTVRGLAPGTWTVRVEAEDGGRRWAGTAEAKAGEPLEVTLVEVR